MPARASGALAKNIDRILDAMPEGVFITDTAGKTLFVNSMYETLTGIKRSDVQGRNVRNLVSAGIFDHALNPEIVRTGRPMTHAQKLKNGKQLVLSGFPVFGEEGGVQLVVTFVRDVTMLAELGREVDSQRRLIDQIHGQLAHMAQEGLQKMPLFESPAMGDVLKRLRRIGPTDATVLILGETGTGKDVYARLTHSLSERRDKIFLKVDCGSISEHLTESELFGYQPGAFTGASVKGKAGYFEIADGGTIFLDEVGELPLYMQTRLLRVLQDGEIVRVGSCNPRRVNVRVIAATNRDLAADVESGAFRRDLYYRLNVAAVHIPPLRERTDDIPLLAGLFLKQYAAKYKKSLTFSDAALEILKAYAWPGNVRELENMVHSLVITLNWPVISARDLPPTVTGRQNPSPYDEEIMAASRPLKAIMADIERDFLLRAVKAHGSVQKVAELFQVNRSTIFRKIQHSRGDGADAAPADKPAAEGAL